MGNLLMYQYLLGYVISLVNEKSIKVHTVGVIGTAFSLTASGLAGFVAELRYCNALNDWSLERS